MASASNTKILFVGDMHLGKRPSIPELEASSIDLASSDLDPRTAWFAIVDYAIAEKIDALALAGDLVDSDDDLFEGRALLEKGIHKLTAAGISVCAVAGNHDTLIMPQLAQSIPQLHLLGPGGTWSEFQVTGQGNTVRLVGWSFPSRHHSTSPLSTPPSETNADFITLGLLHCDLGSQRSQYAPVSVSELEKTGYQGWLLGHVHQPGSVPDFAQLPAPPFYLGSISGTDRSETGIHGPVLVSVGNDGSINAQRIALAPLHWDELDVPMDSLFPGPDEEPWDTRLRNHLMAVLDGLPHWKNPRLAHIKALGLSITLTGKVTEPNRVARAMEAILRSDHPLASPVHSQAVFIRKLTCAVTTLVDLSDLVEREDLPGLLARQILILQNPGGPFSWTNSPNGEYQRLIARGRKELHKVAQEAAPGATSSQTPEPDDATIASMMARAGNRLLDALLEQGRSTHAPSQN